MNNEITLARFSSGMTVVHVACPGSAVAYCGIAVKAGSRNELPTEHGLAHFVEHTIFKGTSHRRAAHIIKRMESVGGELNAYTTKEETVIYSVFPSGNLARAAELIGDLASDSRFPKRELDKEREVVADEIDSYLDSPSDAIFDDFEDLIFKGSPLGHNILGDIQSLRDFDSQSCIGFVSRNYTAPDIVAFYSGNRSSDSVMPLFERYFSKINSSPRKTDTGFETPPVIPAFDTGKSIGSHQSHCLIGARVPGYLDKSRLPVALLANILGGPGMNSLLNVEMRERRGLVYTVDATTALFSDCGLLTIYFGCDHNDLDYCRDIVNKTVRRLPAILTPSKLEAAKRQYLGQLIIASENRENHLLSAVRSALWRKEIISDSQLAESIKAITVDDLLQAARPLLTPSVLTFS